MEVHNVFLPDWRRGVMCRTLSAFANQSVGIALASGVAVVIANRRREANVRKDIQLVAKSGTSCIGATSPLATIAAVVHKD